MKKVKKCFLALLTVVLELALELPLAALEEVPTLPDLLLTAGAPDTGEKLLRMLPLILIVMAIVIAAIVFLRKSGKKHHDDED